MEGDISNYNEMYRECQRNHAASLGSYATDGCGEFTSDDTSPGSALNCAACGCHCNFHRKVTRQANEVATDIIDYSGSGSGSWRRQLTYSLESSEWSKKRFRTKFTNEQKEKMLGFVEKMGWKFRRKDEHGEIGRFYRGVRISRKVFKVWMHNHKNSPPHSASTRNASSLTDQ